VTIGGEQLRLARTASTNEAAFELAGAGCGEGAIVVAAEQTAGRGRQGRKWFSLPGGSLTFSVVLRPCRDRQTWPELPLVTAGSVAEALRHAGVNGVALKAPNDVMVRGAKIAGVLLENRIPGTDPLVVAGIGVNVNIRKEEFPEGIREDATSLEILLGKKKDSEEFLQQVCTALDALYHLWVEEGLAPVRSRLEEEGVAFMGFAGKEPGTGE
jgi:BirA family biotin operon repressor/biotin-[acetyl-CoA-carboxylase] ligase